MIINSLNMDFGILKIIDDFNICFTLALEQQL